VGLLALAALVHLGLLVGWRWQLPLVPYFFDATVLSGGRGLDFYAVYQAGYNARHGRDVYEGDPSKVEIVVPYFTPFRYLPIVAYTAGAALSLAPPLTAYKIWVVVVELVLLLCVFATYRRVRDPDRFAPLALMWLAFTPYYLELFMGQFSLVQGTLIFGMLLLTTEAEKQEKSASSTVSALRFDALWIASVLWKINTLSFMPVLVRLRRLRALALAALIVTAASLPYFLFFPAHLGDFLSNNFGSGVTGHELGNLGFRQLVFEILAALGAPPDVQRLAQFALVALVLGISSALTFLRPASSLRSPSNSSLPTSGLLSLWLVAFFLASPQVWEHHHVMLLPVLVTAYWRRPNWFVFGLWLLLALPTPFGFIGLQPVIAANHALRAFPVEPAWQALLQHASKALPTLLLFVYLARAPTARDA
jgi:hypothetical protein